MFRDSGPKMAPSEVEQMTVGRIFWYLERLHTFYAAEAQRKRKAGL